MKDQWNYKLHADNVLWSISYHNPYTYIKRDISKELNYWGNVVQTHSVQQIRGGYVA